MVRNLHKPAPAPARPSAVLYPCLLLAAAVLVVYAQVYDFDFVNFDDPVYVYENPHTRAGLTWEGLRWAFTTGFESNWLPLTRLSHMFDVEIFGIQAGPHHLVNVALHLANTLLLFGLLRGMTGATWACAWVAAVFAVHPLHVESVAWISERKDVLSTFFGLLSLSLWRRWAGAPRSGLYAAALLTFAASLMAKQMLVTLPMIMLLLDVWPLRRLEISATGRRRLWPLVREVLPFVAIAIAAGCVTVIVQAAGGSVISLEHRPLTARASNAMASYVLYINHLLPWPHDLTFFYPYRAVSAPTALSAGLVLTMTSLATLRLSRSHPYLLVGWFWYLLTLLPVIGLLQVGDQALADRYTYVPSIGLCLMVAWGVPELLANWPRRQVVLTTAAIASLAIYTVLGIQQVGTWRNSEVLLTHALAVTPDNHVAHNNLGSELLKQERFEEAQKHFATSLRLAPGNGRAQINMARTLHARGDTTGALPYMEEAVRLNPDREEAQRGLADLLAETGQMERAAKHYRLAITLGAASSEVHNNLGVALSAGGDSAAALDAFLEALRLDPDNSAARSNAARALAELGRGNEAIAQMETALRLNPDDAAAHLQMAELLVRVDRRADGITHARKALQLQPGLSEAEALLQSLSSP